MKSAYKIAIANRGEIAVRAIRACKELDVTPVLLYSSADKDSLAYRLCEEKICIGDGDPLNSYLNISHVIKGTLSCGAKAVYPGYGFLSESADLALALENNSLVFIGPTVTCLKLFGDKVKSRQKAKALSIPVLPASYNPSLKEAQKIGFPIMIKALHGGGGRGLRVVFTESMWTDALSTAKREAKLAFGKEDVFIEKFLPKAKHIEVQIFADSSGHIHYLFNRDCSVQRKHQKIIEEAPVSSISSSCLQQIKNLSIKLMESVSYKQAGTVEFLYQDSQFYFLEVNPRLQVECPVTEEILKIDLVKAQLLTALGHFPFIDKGFFPKGHSIQCRVYAEDTIKQVPLFGKLHTCAWPVGGVGTRFDMGFESGDSIPVFYDSMIGKIIVWGENRLQAIKRMQETLKQVIIFGVKTNLSFLQDMLSHPHFIKSHIHTNFVTDEFLKSWEAPSISYIDSKVIDTVYLLAQKKLTTPKTFNNPWKVFS